MDKTMQCSRCGRGLAAEKSPATDGHADPGMLRTRGWIAHGTGDDRQAIGLECLTFAESEFLLGGGARPRTDTTVHRAEPRFTRAAQPSPSEAAALR
jgi:hypothetical protein